MAQGTQTRIRGGWRRLGYFWLTVLSLMGTGAGGLQLIAARSEAPVAVPQHHEAEHHAAAAKPVAAADTAPRVSGPIAAPEPALSRRLVLAPPNDQKPVTLPVIAPDGRAPMHVYAAGFDARPHLPRVAVLLAGIGANEAESEAAIRALPAAISFAVPPYAAGQGAGFQRILTEARAAGHEYLIEVPLEPEGFPLNDPGPHTLLTSLPAAANISHLHWVLSRVEGYAGVTGVIGTMRGERLANMPDQMDAILSDLAERGLFYLDPLPGHGPAGNAWGRHADLVIDARAEAGAIDASLAALGQIARDSGHAVGLVMRPSPVAIARLAAWCNGLADHGLALVPVSAETQAPLAAPVKVAEKEH